MIFPYTASSDSSTVTSASATFSPTMAAGESWLFVSSVACWISQGAAPTAAAADTNMFVPAGVQIMISGTAGAKLAVIRDVGDGRASLTRIGAQAV